MGGGGKRRGRRGVIEGGEEGSRGRRMTPKSFNGGHASVSGRRERSSPPHLLDTNWGLLSVGKRKQYPFRALIGRNKYIIIYVQST